MVLKDILNHTLDMNVKCLKRKRSGKKNDG